ncbi:hypothetical protein CONPUDRAFT_159102 [Coniophora puteana RWD-64-598 SS2]|uniref:Uncharacterized protein n=1 Tax=Coniophora puteana (strain RWD-64-598) TaxID=741705 RepID=A0A5M3M8X0_CONPW|nr:uncharacterized protein CONPUDRAFT_159102 [Coniophora puteana RWD-64-598 SS2]EIW75659.1 hypothetical protein CONPUDRAFT_159102 [Coniophora puteana RWD-64-598 SS2]
MVVAWCQFHEILRHYTRHDTTDLLRTKSSSSTPIHARPLENRHRAGVCSPSCSPSPISRRLGGKAARQQQREQDAAVLEALARNGTEHIKLELNGGPGPVRKFFADFAVDRVLRDRHAWYVTFSDGADTARRASRVLGGSGAPTLVPQAVGLVVGQPPSQVTPAPAAGKASWTREEMLEEAARMVESELRALLEKDITERVVGPLEASHWLTPEGSQPEHPQYNVDGVRLEGQTLRRPKGENSGMGLDRHYDWD